MKWKGRVGALPIILADPETLQMALGHLISNALKFTRTRERAVIEVWTEVHPREWQVFIRDNRMGFDPKSQGKLFGVFQQPRSQKVFEGTGVELATVRRIVHRHGGQVWAEGATGQGATFGFCLPKPGEEFRFEGRPVAD